MIAVYVPTLGRPHQLQQLVDNIDAATSTPHRTVFVVEVGDAESEVAARATGATVLVNVYEPSYANSIQTAYEHDTARYFICANDDFDFQPGWDVEALAVMDQPGVQVVGINDGTPRFSTICLVDRTYIQVHSGVVDMAGRVQFPYRHNYVDTEFHATSVMRGVFAAAPDSVIVHRHPDFGLAEQDWTYEKSQATLAQDAQTYAQRQHLWGA